MSDLLIEPFARAFTATVTPPGSKSLTNRALVLACLAEGECELRNVLFADDTLVMLECLSRLGFSPGIDRGGLTVGISGKGGRIPATNANLFCGNSGTTIRFLAALCTLGHGQYNLDGIARMRQRPIRDLADLMNNLGSRVTYAMEKGFPPVNVAADGLPGGVVRFGQVALVAIPLGVAPGFSVCPK